MKIHALLAALALAAPAASMAKDWHGHSGSHSHGYSYSHGYSSCAPHAHSYGYYGSYGYARPYASYYRPYSYYSAPGYYYSQPYVSLSFSSAPRSSYRSAPAYEDGSSLEADVQRELRRRGYYDGRVDGDIGPESRAAIREFQAERGLNPNGRIDGALLRALGL